jgi:hypothetical protein
LVAAPAWHSEKQTYYGLITVDHLLSMVLRFAETKDLSVEHVIQEIDQATIFSLSRTFLSGFGYLRNDQAVVEQSFPRAKRDFVALI